MTLEFNMLIIDDTPDSVSQAVGTLRDYLDYNGFELAERPLSNLSPSSLNSLSRYEGKDYDLVAIDYNLGQEGFDGSNVASILRHALPYTDMVFYSSDASLNLLGRLAEAKVAGVFVATRDELDDALVGLAKTVIGKAVDINQMRGIAMAKIADMDVMMEDTLARAFVVASDALVDAAERTVDKVKQSMAESSTRVDEVVNEDGIVGLVRNARLFSSAQKYHAIRRLCRKMSPQPRSQLTILASYEQDVIANRNMLAHAKEIVTGETTMLQSTGGGGSGVDIDDAWMINFRNKLRTHHSALEDVCTAITDYFSPS